MFSFNEFCGSQFAEGDFRPRLIAHALLLGEARTP